MGRRLGAILVTTGIAAAGVAAACESFSPSSANEPVDASTNDPTSSDASNDSGSIDAPSEDAGGAGWTLVFDEKFEQGIGAWTLATGGAAAHAVIDAGFVAATDSPDSGFIYIRRQPPSPIAYSELRFDTRLAAASFGSPFACVMTVQPGPAQRPSIRLQVQTTGATVLRHERLQAAIGDDHAISAQLEPGKWNEVSIELGVETSSHVRVSFNQIVVLDVPLKEPFPKLERPEVGIGLACDEVGAEVRFDDVALYRR